MKRRTTRPGERSRALLDRPVGLRFKHLGDFVEEVAANLSVGGMFVRTRRPHPVGSIFEFELRLEGSEPPIAGKAQVAWMRRREDGPGEPSGMGVRFVELDDAGRRRVAELVAAHEEAEVAPEDSAPPAAAATAPAVATAGTAPATAPPPATPAPGVAPPAGRAQSADAARRGLRLPSILLAALLVVTLAGTLWWRSAAPATPGEPADPSATPAVEAAATSAPAAAPPARPAQLRLVDDWARAWSEQRVEDYLDAYSASFIPESGLDPTEWERQRRARILAPRRIEVGLAFVELEEIDADTSRVRFVQAYESDSYRDVVRKVLELERETDGWKIVRELVEG